MTTSTEGTASTGVYFHHFPAQQILHGIAEPQWLPPPAHPSSTTTTTTATTNESALDRIERDEEIYLEQLRASSLSYRAPSSLSVNGGSGNTSDHQNSGCYPVVGVLPSSKLMSDIILQFHQEAESIDLLGVNETHDDDNHADGTSKNFFQKHQSQFEELFLQHQQNQRTEGNDASTLARNTGAAFRGPIQSESTAVKAMSSRSGINAHDDASHSSSMMMMSMNSSATTFMSP